MPVTRSLVKKPRGTLRAATDTQYEKRLQEAMAGVQSGKFRTVTAAATTMGVCIHSP
jgi:hypothetical protein